MTPRNYPRRRGKLLRIESLEPRQMLAFSSLSLTQFISQPVQVGTESIQVVSLNQAQGESEPRYLATDHDQFLPNFAHPDLTGERRVLVSDRDGAWSSLFPDANPEDVVIVRHHVTLDGLADVNTVVVEDHGVLSFDPDETTRLRVVQFEVLPGGTLEIGTEDHPVTKSAEVVIKNVPINLTLDPAQYGNGLIVLGKVRMYGHELAESFVRATGNIRAGATSITVAGNISDWRVGDSVYLPDTRQIFYTDYVYQKLDHHEEVKIAAISGNKITLTSAVRYDHLGQVDQDSQLSFAPHVVNMSRNIVIRSENPQGVRGHTMYTGEADVDIRYVQYQDLGRTTNALLDSTTFDAQGNATHIGSNQIGRYSVHVHHVPGPEGGQSNGYQFNLVGNVIHGGAASSNFKWGMAIHDSSYGLIKQNVVYNFAGAGIATEDGSEVNNLFEKNFVARISGTVERGKFSDGREGSGFWLRRPSNYFRDNVVVGAAKAAYAVYGGENANSPLVKIPAFPGAHIQAGEFITVPSQDMRLLEFSGNEAYSSHFGLEIWYLGFKDYYHPSDDTLDETVFKDLHLWNISHTGVIVSQLYHAAFDGLVIIGSADQIKNKYDLATGVNFQGAVQVRIENSNIQNYWVGIHVPEHVATFDPSLTLDEITPFVVQNTKLRNLYNVDIGSPMIDKFAELPPRHTILRNVDFGPVAGFPELNISMSYSDGRFRNVVQMDRVDVYDFDGVAGMNFRVYYNQQKPDFIVPQTGSKSYLGPNSPLGSPEAGLTNQQNWDKYGIAIAGAIIPSDQSPLNLKGIYGLTFAIGPELPPPPPPPPPTPVDAPVVQSISDDTGTPGDGITSDNTLLIRGTATPGSQVTVLRNGSTIGSVAADVNGQWTYDYTGTSLASGNYLFTATAKVGSQTSPESAPLSIWVRTTAPTMPAVQYQIDQGATAGTKVGQLAASDPDPGETLTYAIKSGNTNGAFALDAKTGVLTVANASQVSSPGVFQVTVEVTDSTGATTQAVVTITVVAPSDPIATWVHSLNYTQFGQLTPAQAVYLLPSQLATIPGPYWFRQMSSAARAVLNGEQVRGLNVNPEAMISLLTSSQVDQLSTAQVQSLRPIDFRYLTPGRAVDLSLTQIASIPDRYTFNQMSAAARAVLNGEQVRALNVAPVGMINLLTTSQINQLSVAQIQTLNYQDFRYLTVETIIYLTIAQIKSIPSKYWYNQIPPSVRAAMTPEQIAALPF